MNEKGVYLRGENLLFLIVLVQRILLNIKIIFFILVTCVT